MFIEVSSAVVNADEFSESVVLAVDCVVCDEVVSSTIPVSVESVSDVAELSVVDIPSIVVWA